MAEMSLDELLREVLGCGSEARLFAFDPDGMRDQDCTSGALSSLAAEVERLIRHSGVVTAAPVVEDHVAIPPAPSDRPDEGDGPPGRVLPDRSSRGSLPDGHARP